MSADPWELVSPTGSSPLFVNEQTGEVEKANFGYFRAGSVTLSPEEVLRRREYGRQKEEERQEMLDIIGEKTYRNRKARENGRYVHMASGKAAFEDLPPDTLARATYLATFLSFGDNALYQSQRRKILRKDLPKKLGLAEAPTNRFWAVVKDKYFYRDRLGFIRTLGNGYVMGHLGARFDEEFQKLYIRVVRELYEKIPPRQHKRLGYVLKMLPFLNFEYNILCHNPTERVFDKINPLTVSEFCEAVKFNKTHAADLARDYGRITFTVDGRQEVFCKFLSNGATVENATIYINPRLVYKGFDFKKVEAIGISFTDDLHTT